jgi:hypothetical protein
MERRCSIASSSRGRSGRGSRWEMSVTSRARPKVFPAMHKPPAKNAGGESRGSPPARGGRLQNVGGFPACRIGSYARSSVLTKPVSGRPTAGFPAGGPEGMKHLVRFVSWLAAWRRPSWESTEVPIVWSAAGATPAALPRSQVAVSSAGVRPRPRPSNLAVLAGVRQSCASARLRS